MITLRNDVLKTEIKISAKAGDVLSRHQVRRIRRALDPTPSFPGEGRPFGKLNESGPQEVAIDEFKEGRATRFRLVGNSWRRLDVQRADEVAAK